jgi:hypothetical protein
MVVTGFASPLFNRRRFPLRCPCQPQSRSHNRHPPKCYCSLQWCCFHHVRFCSFILSLPFPSWQDPSLHQRYLVHYMQNPISRNWRWNLIAALASLHLCQIAVPYHHPCLLGSVLCSPKTSLLDRPKRIEASRKVYGGRSCGPLSSSFALSCHSKCTKRHKDN